MIRHECAWCGKHLRTTDHESREMHVSHSICEPCRAKVYAAAGLTLETAQEVDTEDMTAAVEYQEWTARGIA